MAASANTHRYVHSQQDVLHEPQVRPNLNKASCHLNIVGLNFVCLVAQQ